MDVNDYLQKEVLGQRISAVVFGSSSIEIMTGMVGHSFDIVIDEPHAPDIHINGGWLSDFIDCTVNEIIYSEGVQDDEGYVESHLYIEAVGSVRITFVGRLVKA